MNLTQLVDRIETFRFDYFDYKQITVHTGGDSWEEIVDVVWCQECDQYHIISETTETEFDRERRTSRQRISKGEIE